ncbi:MAG: hypothetical protein P4M07_00625 [Xanthobacteraceae bacterium]|nr:hypothetical protein [Xanthobacteraceae bacterium]
MLKPTFKAVPDGSLIVEVEFGGLGDHLFLSPIPRLAKQSGKHERVYISSRSPYRNSETRDLVWGLNPYVDGFVDQPGSPTAPVSVAADENVLSALLRSYGIPTADRFIEPELYYSPRKRDDLAAMKLYDPNYISFVGHLDRRIMEEQFSRSGREVDMQMAYRGRGYPLDRSLPSLSASSLQDFCDIVASAGEYHCLASGGATVAAALNRTASVYFGRGFNRHMFCHSRRHEYVQLELRGFRLAWQAGKRLAERARNKIIRSVSR